MSAEHKALGYRPPPGSLAADAQAAASKHPKGLEGVPKPPRELLAQEALKDAARIAYVLSSSIRPPIGLTSVQIAEKRQQFVRKSSSVAGA